MNRRKPRWFVAAALVALGRHCTSEPGMRFNAADLAKWEPDFARRTAPMLAVATLLQHKYLIVAGESTPKSPCIKPVPYWQLTDAGFAAAKAAFESARLTNPSAFMHTDPADQVNPFAKRLWNLLCIRRALTADQAACNLVDAGDEIAPVRKRCAALLLAWSRLVPDSLQVSAKKVEGFKRYVLVHDLGTLPPAAPPKRSTGAGQA